MRIENLSDMVRRRVDFREWRRHRWRARHRHGIVRGVRRGGGAGVCVISHNAGEAVAAGIRERGGRGSCIACDVTDAGAVGATFARILGEAGRLDVLVNCAGGFWKQLSVEETPEDEWDKVIDLNLKSIFLCAKAAIPTFKRQRSGRIVNVGSMAGVSALTRSSPPYSAAKAGVHSLTRVLAFELGEHGVTANALAPGTTFDGPAIVEERESTAVLGPGARCRVDDSLALIVEVPWIR